MTKKSTKISVLLLVVSLFAGSISDGQVMAARKKPKFSTKKMTITVGKSKKLKVKNAKGYTLSWKIKKKKIASLKKSGKYARKVVAKKAGTTKIICKLKKKGKGKKTLTCKVIVVPKKKVTKKPVTTAAPTSTVTSKATAKPSSSVLPVPTATVESDKATPTPTFSPVVYKSAGFETGTDGFSSRGGSEKLSSVSGGHTGKCLSVTGRGQSWHGASLDITDTIVKGATYRVSAWVKQDSGSKKTIKVSCALTSGGQETYPEVGKVETTSGVWTKFEATYTIPKSFTKLTIYFESTEDTFDFCIDDFSMTQITAGVVVPSQESMASIKDTYSMIFANMGTCLSYNGWTAGKQMQDESLMKLVTKHYNSFTLENELKPDAILNKTTTMSVETAKGSAYQYVIPDKYKESTVPVLNFDTLDRVLEIAKQKGLRMRGHTLLWHQQTPVRFFKTGYSDSGSNVSKETMDARLEFYVRTVMSHVLEKEKELTGSAGSLVYAWDVVNEYTHRTNDPTATSWVDIYGNLGEEPTYVKDAYVYAYDELKKEGVENQVSLFLNDYNTYDVADELVRVISYINADGVICKGVGMQSHLDVDYPTVEKFGKAVDTFSAANLEIQITELDVTINCKWGTYDEKLGRTDTDQANYLYDLMSLLIAKKESGANITGVTFWGLYDTISWRASYSPLLFASGMDDPKESFYKVIEAAGK